MHYIYFPIDVTCCQKKKKHRNKLWHRFLTLNSYVFILMSSSMYATGVVLRP